MFEKLKFFTTRLEFVMSRVDLRVRILLTFLTDMITTMLDDSYGGLEENKRKTYACLFLGK